jgi:membrane-associated PAP2 superfamily phosphatase
MTASDSPAPAVSPSSSAPFNLQRTLWPVVVLGLTLFAVFEFTDLDLLVQDRFFDFATGTWMVDATAPLPRALFYNGPKYLIILLGLTVLTLALGPAAWRNRWGLDRRRLWAVFLAIGIVPALIGQMKGSTNVYCPYEIRRYGGDVPYVKVLERHPTNDRPERCGRCFPAGHASGGFALFALAGLFATRRSQLVGLVVGQALGWWMGAYQMLKGAHYLSHTLITMVLAWIGFLLIQRLVRVRAVPPT